MTYRCWCGHFPEEHTFSIGCAGCDAGGKPIETIEHNYEPDTDWPETVVVWVTARNDDGDIEHEYGEGGDTDAAVAAAIVTIIARTGDDTYVMDDWEAA